jgi:chromosome segregation ATPase
LNEKWHGDLEAVKWYDLENEILNYYEKIKNKDNEYDLYNESERVILESILLVQPIEETNELIQKNKDIVTAYDDATKILKGTLQDFINGIVTNKEELDEYQEVAEKFGYKTVEDLQQALIDAGGSVEEFEDALSNGEDAAKEYARSILNSKSEIEELNEAIAAHTANLQSIQSAYATLTAAVEEYNSTGSFTAETLSKLNGLTAEQIAALETHNGVMSVNVDLLQQQFEAEKQEMISKLQLAKQIAIVALEEQYLNQEAEATGSQLETQQTINENTATTYQDIYTAASQAAAGVAKVRAALGEDSDEYKQFLEERKSIIDDYDKMIDDVKKTSLSLASANKS